MKGGGALGWWGQKLRHGADGAVMEVGGARPNAIKACGPILLSAADAGFGGGGVARDFEFGEELVEVVRLILREADGALWLGADLIGAVEALVAFRAAVAGGAVGLIQH